LPRDGFPLLLGFGTLIPADFELLARVGRPLLGPFEDFLAELRVLPDLLLDLFLLPVFDTARAMLGSSDSGGNPLPVLGRRYGIRN